VLAHAYAEPPYHVGTGYRVGRALALTIVCTGAGIFPGDDLCESIRVESGAQVLLTSQSALQAHAGRAAPCARLQQQYDVEPGGELHCQWDPLIPFAGARLVHEVDIRVGAGARLYWSDALMSGRVGRGESWACTAMAHQLTLAIDGSLAYLERYTLDPAWPRAPQPWIAGTTTFFGTALICHPSLADSDAESLQHALNALPDLHAGVDLTDTSFVVGRIAARHGAAFRQARTLMRAWAAAVVFAQPDLRVRR
jgi:urease accessory protein